MQVEFLKPHGMYQPGTVADLPGGVAQALAQRVPPVVKVIEIEQETKAFLQVAPENKAVQPVFQRKKRRSPFRD